MKGIYSILFFVLSLACTSGVWGQACTYTMSLFSQLSSGQIDSESATLAGDLTSVTFNLNFTGTGASYPADMMVYLYAPNGDCIVWGGWNINPTGGCTDVGTGFQNSWPDNWSTTVNGFYTYTLNTNANGLDGSGTWSVTIQNAWTGSAVATYDLDIVFNGICEGDCFDPNACNFVPDAELINNELCIYPIDLYPDGLLDCDGNCYLDMDGDGICDALEVPGCQEPWACNYNPQATDPPLPINPCSYPESSEIDCDGNSLLPQFLSQPQDATVSCNGIPVAPGVSAQPAPAAVAYYSLFPESCYDVMEDVEFSFTETIYPGSCPGNYTIDRNWIITDCNGFQNAILQTITVVDNLPPVVISNLTPDTIDCNDPVMFLPLQAEEVCGGGWSVVGEPSFVFLSGSCEGESVQKKYTTITDECGNATEVEQVLIIEDNDPPYWLEDLPQEQIFTDNIEGEVFDPPVADDVCSNFEVNMSSSYNEGPCPLSVVLTRTFVAIDQCGNTSAPFVQTITEETDLEASIAATTPVSCHNGEDGMAEVNYSGGVAPYTVDWNGYDPEALPAGDYTVEVLDANLCSVEMDFLITEPAPFTLNLTATSPECNDLQSGIILSDVSGGTGNITIDWNGVNPNAVSAGVYNATAFDESGCEASASITVAPAEIPESLELSGDVEVVQGDSAAYFYEYTLGSSYDWWFEGALEEQVLTTFAISVLWDTTGFVCVQETNQDGCVGDSVCLDVTVIDDVWNIHEPLLLADVARIYPNPTTDLITVSVPSTLVGQKFTIFDINGMQVAMGQLESESAVIDLRSLSAGSYLFQFASNKGVTFQVFREQ